MTDTELLAVISAKGSQWRRLLERAIAGRLRDSIASNDDDACNLQAWIEEVDFSLKRAVYAAKTGQGDIHEASIVAAEGIVGLGLELKELRTDALASFGMSPP